MNDTTVYRPSAADRVGIWVFIVAGVGILAWSAFTTASRIMHVLLGEDVPVTAHFMGLAVEAPIGPNGALVPVELETATLYARGFSAAGFGAAIIAATLGFLTVAAVVICLLLLARNTLRGRIFTGGNTRLVTAAGLTALVGFGLVPVFEGMVANDTVRQISNGEFVDDTIFVATPLPFVLLAFAFAIIATAYTVGARIQRDHEGLV